MKYLVQASYTAEGSKGVMKDGGTGRKKAIEAAVKSVGGKLDGMYFCIGDIDVMLIIDVPDTASAVAVGVAASASGAARTKTTQLLTVEEMDAAVKKTVKYRAPGE
jgi:uncharacterized protein with GYD domain